MRLTFVNSSSQGANNRFVDLKNRFADVNGRFVGLKSRFVDPNNGFVGLKIRLVDLKIRFVDPNIIWRVLTGVNAPL